MVSQRFPRSCFKFFVVPNMELWELEIKQLKLWKNLLSDDSCRIQYGWHKLTAVKRWLTKKYFEKSVHPQIWKPVQPKYKINFHHPHQCSHRNISQNSLSSRSFCSLCCVYLDLMKWWKQTGNIFLMFDVVFNWVGDSVLCVFLGK